MNDFYRGRRVLVVGGLGFIGLNLVRALLDAEAKVKILNRSLEPLALSWLKQLARGRPVEICQGDIADPEVMRRNLPTEEVVFNLAGQSGAVRSLTEAWADMQTNVAGHLNLLEVVRQQAPPPHLVFVSSRLVYGVTGCKPVNEDHPTYPTSLYGLHKLTVEHYYRLYHLHYGLSYAVLRLTNPYGSFQLPQRHGYGIINRFIMKALRGETLTIFGDAQQLRDYIYISDAVQALMCAGCNAKAVGQTFNVGQGHSVTFEAMATMILSASSSGRLEKVPWPEPEKRVETGHFLCDISRIQNMLGWKPEVDLETGLRQTVQAYRALLSNINTDINT